MRPRTKSIPTPSVCMMCSKRFTRWLKKVPIKSRKTLCSDCSKEIYKNTPALKARDPLEWMALLLDIKKPIQGYVAGVAWWDFMWCSWEEFSVMFPCDARKDAPTPSLQQVQDGLVEVGYTSLQTKYRTGKMSLPKMEASDGNRNDSVRSDLEFGRDVPVLSCPMESSK